MKTFSREYLVLLFALSTFGCSTAVINIDDDDAQTVAVDASNGGTDVLSNNADAAAQQNTDNKAVNSADVQSADTAKSADVAQKTDAADTFGAKPDVHHDTNTNDAGTDMKSTADAGSSNVDTQANDTDASNDTDSVDTGADVKSTIDTNNGDTDTGSPFKCQSNEECNTGLSCQKYECLFGVVTNGVKGSECSIAYFQEVCDGIDNNCNGLTDEDEKWMQTYYEDKDKDSFGNPNKSKKACSKPIGHVITGTDCDDNDNMTWPGTFEQCDGKDNNCNGVIDDGVQLITYYVDEDDDGYGSNKNPTFPSTTQCSNIPNIPSYYVPNKDDCNDKNATVHPGAKEICNGIDDDCNWQIDDGLTMSNYYPDSDGDGYGNAAISIIACKAPAEYVLKKTDCDDNNPNIHPGTTGMCDSTVDGNCDGYFGGDATCYTDNDKDGYCVQDTGANLYCSNGGGDCNDNDKWTHPTTEGCIVTCVPAPKEICGDGYDNNCNGETDEGCEEGGCGPMEDVCDPVTCATLGGTCDEFGACNSFCDSCATYTACEDTNQDGLGDKCTSIPSNMIAPYYKGLDNAIVVVLPNVSLITDFDFGFQTYKKTSEKGTKWTDYTQWQLDSNFFVMNFLINGDIKTSPNVGFNDPEVCGIRFNADIDTTGKTQLNPSNHWLCEGNGTTAHWYDPATRFFHVKDMVLIEVTKHVQKWSAPGGPTDGCSALLPIKSTCPQ